MSTPDHDIERGVYQTPSNDDELYDDYDEEDGFGRGPVFAIFAVIVLASFVGVVWLAYQQGLEQGRQTAPPIITASIEPFKVEPDDPQGMAAPEESITANTISGQPLEEVASVTSSTEVPIEVPQTSNRDAAPALRTSDTSSEGAPTTRPITTQPATGSSDGLTVPPPSNRVRNASADEDLQTASSVGTETTTQPPQRTTSADTPARTQPGIQAAADAQGPPAPGAASPSGNFVVQVASLPNQVDADAAWARLQSRHGSLVGPYSQDVQAVDLGDRGTWYRLRIGYFEARGDATALCEQLQGAGQDCLVTSR